jgi:hypothetical protein
MVPCSVVAKYRGKGEHIVAHFKVENGGTGLLCNICGQLLPDCTVSRPTGWYRVFHLILHCHL